MGWLDGGLTGDPDTSVLNGGLGVETSSDDLEDLDGDGEISRQEYFDQTDTPGSTYRDDLSDAFRWEAMDAGDGEDNYSSDLIPEEYESPEDPAEVPGTEAWLGENIPDPSSPSFWISNPVVLLGLLVVLALVFRPYADIASGWSS